MLRRRRRQGDRCLPSSLLRHHLQPVMRSAHLENLKDPGDLSSTTAATCIYPPLRLWLWPAAYKTILPMYRQNEIHQSLTISSVTAGTTANRPLHRLRNSGNFRPIPPWKITRRHRNDN